LLLAGLQQLRHLQPTHHLQQQRHGLQVNDQQCSSMQWSCFIPICCGCCWVRQVLNVISSMCCGTCRSTAAAQLLCVVIRAIAHVALESFVV
jgi:hypothetical protein